MIWTSEEITWLKENLELPLKDKAEKLGRTEKSVRHKIDHLFKLGDIAERPVHIKETVYKNTAGTIFEGTLPLRQITPENLHETYNIDPEQFIISKVRVGASEAITKDLDGVAHVHQLLNGKFELEPNKECDFYAMAAEAMRNRLPQAKMRTSEPTRTGSKVAEIAIVDHHFGKYVLKKSTGYATYDLEEATLQHRAALENLVSKLMVYDVGKVIYVFGNDLLHVDTKTGTTTKGTPQTTCAPIDGIYTHALHVTLDAIDFLRKHFSEVIVVCTPGNHDTLACWFMSKTLEAHYRNCPEVKHLNTPQSRQYVSIGNTIIMYTHGDKIKHDKLASKMPGEIEWIEGKFRFKEIHVGHFHHEKSKDIDGIMCRVLPALVPVDDWHNDYGWIGSNLRSMAFVYDPVAGCEGIVYHTPHYDDPEIAHYAITSV